MEATFYVDEDMPKALAVLLRDLGYDAVYTREAGNEGQLDPEQLAFAAQHGRVVVTSNLDDFRMLHEAWMIWTPSLGTGAPVSHPGIIVLPNANSLREALMASVIDQFVRSTELTTLQNRLLRYRSNLGWEDLSALRGSRFRAS